MHGEDRAVAFRERHHFDSRLHARALFGEHELATREFGVRGGQQEHGLQRKDVLAVKILVQAVVIVGPVLQ